MKSDDYKRGVREMAAAIREAYSLLQTKAIEQRLLADPVPKFKIGDWVLRYDRCKDEAYRITKLNDDGTYKIGEFIFDVFESELHALTPLEATGKE